MHQVSSVQSNFSTNLPYQRQVSTILSQYPDLIVHSNGIRGVIPRNPAFVFGEQLRLVYDASWNFGLGALEFGAKVLRQGASAVDQSVNLVTLNFIPGAQAAIVETKTEHSYAISIWGWTFVCWKSITVINEKEVPVLAPPASPILNIAASNDEL